MDGVLAHELQQVLPYAVIGEKDAEYLHRIADRERSPYYEVGEVTNNNRFTFESKTTGEKPMDKMDNE